MSKRLIISCAAVLFVLASLSESRAQFGGYGTMETNGDVDKIYIAVFGRGAQPNELVAARKAGFDNSQALSDSQSQQFQALLKKHLRMLIGQAELRGVITRSHQIAFGREPKDSEMSKWFDEIQVKQKDLGYSDLIKAHRLRLMMAEGSGDRPYAIMHAYLNALGRAPQPGEMDYWKALMLKGKTYHEVLLAQMEWILGTSAGQAIEFRETIKRAFAIAKLPAPNSDQVAHLRVKIQNRRKSFQQLVEVVRKDSGKLSNID